MYVPNKYAIFIFNDMLKVSVFNEVFMYYRKVLASVTKMYFRGDEVMGERALCMCMFGAYLLASMMVLIVDERTLEVGLDSAYESFQIHASEFLKAQGLPST